MRFKRKAVSDARFERESGDRTHASFLDRNDRYRGGVNRAVAHIAHSIGILVGMPGRRRHVHMGLSVCDRPFIFSNARPSVV